MIVIKQEKKFIILDIILVVISLYASLLLKFDLNIEEQYLNFFKISIIPVIIITLFFNNIFNLYTKLWKYASVDELLSIIYSITLSNVVFMLYSYLISFKLLSSVYFRFPFKVHLIFWLLSVSLLGGTRFLYRIVYENKLPRHNKEDCIDIIIIGAGDAAALLIKEIKKHRELMYNIIGLMDDDDNKQGKLICGVKVIGKTKEIPQVVETYGIEEIILAIPSVEYQIRKKILEICKETKCKLKTIPGIYEIIDGKVNISKLRDVSIEDLLGRDEVKLDNSNINKYIKDKVVMVTGGGGSIGSELCRQIAKFNPKELLILDNYENNAYDLQMELNYKFPNMKKQVIIANIRELSRLREIFDDFKPEVIFHAAAHKHVPLMEDNPSEAIKNNIIGTYNLVRCADEFKILKFVQISTDKAVNPTNIMGATKRFCELIIQAYDKKSSTEYVAVRFGNVLGSNGSVIPLFKSQIAHGGPITLTHPDINRFFMTIPEAAQLVIQAGAIANGGEIFVLDMGEPVKIADLAKDLITLSGLKLNTDIKIEYIGLRPGEKLYEELLMDEVALTSTVHSKIFIEKPIDIDVDYIEKSILDFEKVVLKDKELVFKMMEDKVPTYIRRKE